jgi:hypothetical protein
MKSIFFCLAMLFSCTGFSQVPDKKLLDSLISNFRFDSSVTKKPGQPFLNFKRDSVVNSLSALMNRPVTRNWTRIDSNKLGIVYALPLDNMPCIVPDMEAHRTMPNAGNKGMLKNPVDPGIYSRQRTSGSRSKR